ncbi:T9SS type A sorting domain-containing protein, partial [bacterium]|nr:T9SS type A sorting domain-containing protein [bacterium]
AIPESVELLQNYPNPFNASTVIRYEIPDAANVTLTVYNTNGQAVATLQSGLQEAGRHEIQWNAADVASGIYVYVLKYNEKTLARKMILIH